MIYCWECGLCQWWILQYSTCSQPVTSRMQRQCTHWSRTRFPWFLTITLTDMATWEDIHQLLAINLQHHPRLPVTIVITSANEVEGSCVIILFVCVIMWAGLLKKYRADFIETWCCDWAYQPEELTDFGGALVPDTNSRSLFHFPHYCGMRHSGF